MSSLCLSHVEGGDVAGMADRACVQQRAISAISPQLIGYAGS
jgi:hypothetical protein